MHWQRKSPYHLTGDLGYKIARFKVGADIYYRASFRGDFITPRMTDLSEAKHACLDHAKERADE